MQAYERVHIILELLRLGQVTFVPNIAIVICNKRYTVCLCLCLCRLSNNNNNNNLFDQRLTDRRLVCTTASHRYERCWSGASRLPTARSSLQAAYSQHRPCGALVPAEAGPNFAAWWAGVDVCEQLTQGCYAVCLGGGSNSRPSDRESRALTVEPLTDCKQTW